MRERCVCPVQPGQLLRRWFDCAPALSVLPAGRAHEAGALALLTAPRLADSWEGLTLEEVLRDSRQTRPPPFLLQARERSGVGGDARGCGGG